MRPRPGWRNKAACRTHHDPDLWFPPHEGHTHREVLAAKNVCSSCPARHDCFAYALNRGEDHGIWGGFTSRERRQFEREAAEHRRRASG